MSVVNPAFAESVFSWRYTYLDSSGAVVSEKGMDSVCDVIKAVFLSPEHGFVVATDVESFTGPYLYSDYAYFRANEQTTFLNNLSKIPVLGILAAITRVVLAIIHITVHSIQALIFQEKGHLYHALKGGCEISRGLIDAIPILGRISSWCKYSRSLGPDSTHWTTLKIYNPNKPDLVDQCKAFWRNPSPVIITFRA